MKLLSIGALFLIFNCTGVNIGYGIYRITGNTNPAVENSFVYGPGPYRGGWVYYKDTIPGQINGKIEKLSLTGKACSDSYLWLISTGDSSIEAAKNNGKIQKVGMVQHEITAFLGFVYHSHCTIVTGE